MPALRAPSGSASVYPPRLGEGWREGQSHWHQDSGSRCSTETVTLAFFSQTKLALRLLRKDKRTNQRPVVGDPKQHCYSITVAFLM